MNIKKIEAQPMEKKKIRVAAYCRVSTDHDDQRESLETQKQHYEAWIKMHSDWEFAGVFYDFGITGTKADVRDGLQALMYECRIGRINYVLTKSISRFSRNTSDCLSLVRELLSYNIPIYFEKENIDTGSMESELVLSILSSMAQDESESISKNVKWSAKKRFSNGTYKFSCVPYGYIKDENGNMVIEPSEADIVTQIFNLVVSGKGTYRIAQELNKNAVPTRKGSKWTTTTLLDILSNEKYIGEAKFQKTYTDDSFHRHKNKGKLDSPVAHEHHEPIISKELFYQAQQVIQQRAKERGIQKGSGVYQKRYCFSGKMICGECGGKFKRQTLCSGIAWVCSTHLYDIENCSIKSIRDDVIKAAFLTMMNKLIFGRKLMLRPFYDSLKLMNSDENFQRVLTIKKLLQRNSDRKNDLRKLRVQGIIDNAVYTQEMNKIEKENTDYRTALQNTQSEESYESLKELEKLLHFTETSKALSEFNEDIFTDFADQIIVYSRTCVGFKLKCGLTLKEELCTDITSKMVLL